jgi:hypothetical protein
MTIDAAKTTYASSAPRQAAFLVYINGIEVPAKSASLRYGVWQIPELQVEMVADPVLVRLGAEDRVQVVVFYFDDCDVATGVEPQFRCSVKARSRDGAIATQPAVDRSCSPS